MSDIRRRQGSGNQMHCFRDDHEVSREILQAREKAHAKHGINSIESIPADSPRWLPILAEEFGEIGESLTYDKDSLNLRPELVDFVSVTTAWIEAIDSMIANGMSLIEQNKNKKLRSKLIKASATATAWIEAIDQREGDI